VGSEYERLSEAASWYESEQLDIDRALVRFRYHELSPHFVGSKCLELGPADGVMTELLRTHFKSLTVVDAAEHLLDLIPDGPEVSKVCALFEDFSPSERFDTIVADHVLEHVIDPGLILRRVRGWLTVDGVVLIGVPNAHSIHRLAAVKMGLLQSPWSLNDRDVAVGHRRVYDRELLRRQIQDAGFTIRHEGGVFLKPVSNSQIERTWTKDMVSAFAELGRELPELAAEIIAVCGLS
jgi:2-polyprenyl-3-methyl-5-hydroxy-6-metoxy-1,4-benzoquinol methylase